MALKHRQHAGGTAQVMLWAGIAASCVLTGCASGPETAAQGTLLSAAQDSDLLAMPAEREYEILSIELPAETTLQGFTLPDAVAPEGYFILGDGVISEARFELILGDVRGTQATTSFELTEPTVLRRDRGEASLTAVGTLTMGGVERPETSVQFSVAELNDEHAVLKVLVDPPADLLAVGGGDTSIAARITFNAR